MLYRFNKAIVPSAMVLLLTAATLFVSCGKKGGDEVPYKEVNTAEMKKIFDAKEDYTLIDSRGTIFFQDSHIPGSLDISDKKMATTDQLPGDKGKKMIFYCGGLECDKSANAAKDAAKMGYTNLYVYSEGIPAWKKAGYPVDGIQAPSIDIPKITRADFEAMMKKDPKKIFFLDVRTKKQREEGVVDGATWISSEELHTRMDEVPKDKHVYILCRTGTIALTAARIMRHRGWAEVSIFDGGFVEWNKGDAATSEKKEVDLKASGSGKKAEGC